MKRLRSAAASFAVLAAATLLSGATAERPLRMLMLDADGGAATLFVTPEGKSLLVDAGWPTGMPGGAPAAHGTPAPQPPAPTITRVIAGMKRLGITKIDALLITHYHLDHVGGIHDILARIPVGTVFDHGPNRELLPGATQTKPSPNHPAILYRRYEEAVAGRKRRVVAAGETLAIGSLKLNFVSADGKLIARPLPGRRGRPSKCDTPDKANATDENPRSVGFVATWGKARILDLADLTWNEEKRLVCPVNTLGAIDLLLVGHHGSELSNNPSLIEATAPRVALVGNGARKGGDAWVFRTLAAASAPPAVWYQHQATRSPDANPKPDNIANMTLEPDGANSLDVLIFRNGAVRVTNTRSGYTESYPAR